MALRFTCTNKWEDAWFLDLSPTHKLIHLYIVDRCDCAGIWKVSLKDLEFRTGATNADFGAFCLAAGKERLWQIDAETIWLVKFVPFQYPKVFNANNPAVKGIAARLLKIKAPYEMLGSPYVGAIKSLNGNHEEAPTKPLASPIGEGEGIGIGEGIGEGERPEGIQGEVGGAPFLREDWNKCGKLLNVPQDRLDELWTYLDAQRWQWPNKTPVGFDPRSVIERGMRASERMAVASGKRKAPLKPDRRWEDGLGPARK